MHHDHQPGQPCACRSHECQLRITEQAESQKQDGLQVEMPSDTRQHGLSQARTSCSSNESDNRTNRGSNKLHPIGSRRSIRCQTHVLTGCIALDVPHGTSARQLSPHFKSNKTPLPGTAWLDGTTRTVTDVPFLLTSLSCQPRLLFFSQSSLSIDCSAFKSLNCI